MSLGQSSGSGGYGGQQRMAPTGYQSQGGQQGAYGMGRGGGYPGGRGSDGKEQRYRQPQGRRMQPTGRGQDQRSMNTGGMQASAPMDPFGTDETRAMTAYREKQAALVPPEQRQQQSDQDAWMKRSGDFSRDFTNDWQNQHGQEGSAASPYASQVNQFMQAGVPDEQIKGWLSEYVGSHGGNTMQAFGTSHGGDQGAFTDKFEAWQAANPGAKGDINATRQANANYKPVAGTYGNPGGTAQNSLVSQPGGGGMFAYGQPQSAPPRGGGQRTVAPGGSSSPGTYTPPYDPRNDPNVDWASGSRRRY